MHRLRLASRHKACVPLGIGIDELGNLRSHIRADELEANHVACPPIVQQALGER